MSKQISKVFIIMFSIICLGLLFYKVVAEDYNSSSHQDVDNFRNIKIGDRIVGLNETNTLFWRRK